MKEGYPFELFLEHVFALCDVHYLLLLEQLLDRYMRVVDFSFFVCKTFFSMLLVRKSGRNPVSCRSSI